jgi:hypothetical protein
MCWVRVPADRRRDPELRVVLALFAVGFHFEDALLERMINDVCWPHVETFLAGPLAKLKGEQKAKIESITATYPSVAFGDVDELQDKVPSGELKEDAIYGHLSENGFAATSARPRRFGPC